MRRILRSAALALLVPTSAIAQAPGLIIEIEGGLTALADSSDDPTALVLGRQPPRQNNGQSRGRAQRPTPHHR